MMTGPRRSQDLLEFWTAYVRINYAVLAGESLAAVAYFLLTPSGSHRALLVTIASVSVTVAIGAGILSGRIAGHGAREQLTLLATVLSGVILAVCIHLDGGISSPLVYLIVLPVMSAALGLPESGVLICGVATVVEIAVVAIADASVARYRDNLLVLSAFILGAIVLSAGSARSRTRLQSQEAATLQDLSRLAQTDALTGCLNHGAFYAKLAIEVDRSLRYGQPLSLMMADVDLFKAFNDTRGHPAGDAALAGVGSALMEGVRSSDVVARIGGDEFAVLLPATALEHDPPGTASDSVLKMAERISTAVFEQDGSGVTLSIGIATLDPAEPTARRLVRDADAALYRAKANGRGVIATSEAPRIVQPDGASRRRVPDETAVEDNKRLEDQLRQAERQTSETLSILDVLQSSAPVGLGFVDRELRFLRINQMLAEVHGGSVSDQLGRTVSEVVPRLWPQLEPTYRRVLETGEAATIDEVVGETAADPGASHYWLTNLYPIFVDHEIAGIGIVVVDITDRKKLEESQRALTHTVVAALGAAVEVRDPYTSGHQKRVAEIATAIATDLGCDSDLIDDIELAARIHDLGKVGIPTEILGRPGRLSDIEMQLVRGHAQIGYDLLETVGFPGRVPDMILQHHERLDGSGYPNHLRGDEISLGAKIVAVADVAEAMTSHRPYRPALALELALKELQVGRGGLFDPDAVDACLRLVHSGRLVLGG